MMRKAVVTSLTLLALCVLPVALHALTIQNNSDGVFYFVLDRAAQSDLQALKDTPQAIAQYILSHQNALAYVPPGGVQPDIDAGAGPLAVLGFFVHPGDRSYPVAAVFVSAADTSSSFTVDENRRDAAGNVSVRAIDVTLGNEPVLIDNRYLDWLKVPTMARYPDYFVPRRFVREEAGNRKDEPIDSSLYWKKGGTQIQYFKAVRSESYLYLLFSSASELSPGLSYMLYLFHDRTSGPGKYTVEIPVDGQSGLVVLWQNGTRTPRVIGDFVHSTFFIEARIRLDQLPVDLATSGWSIDLATLMRDAGLIEEFYFSTLFVRDIPR
ncbi:MAG TPA: hypothetical protein VMW87_00975 [Spirochaetia bacterium]|nr:hypothetical protein [Spirochaetia bacterium]